MLNTRPTLFGHPLIGWKEHINLPRLRVGPIVAKIDTGARTAALHADKISVIGKRVRFEIDGEGHTVPIVAVKRVKSSNGSVEKRVVIETEIELGQHRFLTEVTLTDRTDMGVPMLLGRATIKKRFVVHPGRSFMLSPKKKKPK